MRVLRTAFAGFLSHQGFFLAAGLAFYIVICFVPFLFLLVSLTGYVLSAEAVMEQIRDALARTVPVYQDEITRALLRIIETRTHSGLLGSAILLLFSTPLFAAFRFVLNRVLGVRGQPLLHGFLFDSAMIVVVGLFFVGNVASTALLAWFKLLAARQIEVAHHWLGRTSFGLGLLFSTATCFVIYRFFPYRPVRVRAALVGALAAGILWEVARQLIRVYVLNLGLYDQIYGPLGVLMAFVMFIYYSALVFVLGAEIVGAADPGN
jgi:membrane protein